MAGCTADEPAWTAHDLGTDAEFRGILFLDEQSGWIVGGQPGIDGGVVGRTDDGGRTWRFQSGLVRVSRGISLFHLNAIHFIDADNACMVGSGGMILRSEDGGDNWRVVRRGRIYSRLYDIDFIDDGRGWAVGWDFVLTTEDGGHTWSEHSENRVDGQAVEFLSTSDGWIASRHGTLHRTLDGGETWERIDDLDVTGEPHFWDMAFVDSTHGWVVGQHGVILCTLDGGETWASQQSGVDALLTSVSFVDPSEGWVVGYTREKGTSYILHTADGGSTWVVQTEVEGEELQAIFMMRGSGWAVGERVSRNPQQILRFSDHSAATARANLAQQYR